MNDRNFSDTLVWIANSPIISIDTETHGLHCYEYDRVMGIGVANEHHEAYFPLRHPSSHNLSYDQAHNLIELLSMKRKHILFHNAIFDWPFLRLEGWRYPNPYADLWDTMVVAWLLDENEPKKLEEQVEFHIDARRAKEQKERQKRVKKIGWENATYEEMQAYGANDARNTYDLYLYQAPLIAKDSELAIARVRENWFIRSCDEMIEAGVRVNRDEALVKLQECDKLIDALECEYPDLNFDSPPQIAKLLFTDEGWGLSATDYTSTGQASTSKDTLLRYLPYEPRIQDIFDYRKLRKARSTYYFPLTERVGIDGRVHPWYRPHGTKTGRMSCLASGTAIRTSLGEKPIEDIRPGDLVWTHRNRWRAVTAQWFVGIEPVYQIHLSNGECVTCTPDHRLLTLGGWKTAQEFCDERQQAVGERSRESGKCAAPVSRSASFIAATSREGTRNDRTQRYGGPSFTDVGSRVGRDDSHTQVCRETRLQEPDEREIGFEAPQLEGGMRRWLRIQDHQSEWTTGVRASDNDGEGAWSAISTPTTGRASHRRGSSEQFVGQPRSRDSWRSQNHSLLAGEGQRVLSIEEIHTCGSDAVYDLSVEEDESYFACGVFSHNCSDPNCQTLPHEETLPGIKDCFIAADGYSLIECDLSQAELRVAAYYADDAVLREHLSSGDVHSATAIAMFGDAEPAHRFVGKTVNFSSLYGVGAKKLSLTSKRSGGAGFTEDQARQYLGQWRNLYGGVTRALRDAQKVAEERGFVKLWPIGRRRRFDTYHARFENPKDALSSIVQGGVGELVKELMLHLRAPAQRLGVRIVLNVHDSIVSECPVGTEDEWTRIVRATVKRINPFQIEMPLGAKKW